MIASEVLSRMIHKDMNTAEQLLEEAQNFVGDALATSNSTNYALMGIGHALLAIKGELERIADRLEDASVLHD